MKTGRNISQTLVISLKYENKVTVKKFPFMKVQNNAKPSSILGGEMTRYNTGASHLSMIPAAG